LVEHQNGEDDIGEAGIRGGYDFRKKKKKKKGTKLHDALPGKRRKKEIIWIG